MKTIKLSLEYGAWPLWLLDEEGQVIDTAMPEEWADQKELESILNELQRLYESQFIDDGKVFDWSGFQNKDDEERFNALLAEVRQAIPPIVPKGWKFVDGTD